MRRNLNRRKRNQLFTEILNRKAWRIILLLLVFLFCCIVAFSFFIQNVYRKKNVEKQVEEFTSSNENIPFSIRKIILFSSATASSSTVNHSPCFDISQYCDIGIYFDTIQDESNLIQSLSIQDIIISSPERGTPCLYKKRIHDLGTCTYQQDLRIDSSFDFSVIPSNHDLLIDEDNYEIYDNASTPLSLGFYNQNVKTDWITIHPEIRYNGTLLKNALIPQSSLECTVSFTIHIVTISNEHYIGNISFAIPFEDEDGSLYDIGYTSNILQKNEISKFIRIH